MADAACVAAKSAMRKTLNATLRELASEYVVSASEAACRRMVQLEQFARASAVSVYLCMPGELETNEIVACCFASGKAVFVPKIVGRGRADMIMVRVDSQLQLQASECFEKNRWGIPEPTASFVEAQSRSGLQSDDIDFVVVPGLGFDSEKGRLGRGKGYYDTFIASLVAQRSAKGRVRPFLAAIAFDEQVVERVPLDGHDEQVDVVVTSTRLIE